MTEIGYISRVALNPGDKVVVHLAEGSITQESIRKVMARMKEAFPDNDVIVMDGRIGITIVGPDVENWVDAEHF